MEYYKYKDSLIISEEPLSKKFTAITEEEALSITKKVYYLGKRPLNSFRSYFKVSSIKELHNEDINVILKEKEEKSKFYKVLSNLSFINLNNDNWEELLEDKLTKKYKINIVGLGDVGGTLLTGLRLLGSDVVENIGIYDLDKNKVERWYFEANQIYDINNKDMPKVIKINEEELFNCDLFIFCVSVFVPKVGDEKKDVRMVQFEGNKKVISLYSKMARKANFKGDFAVISDPVDLLCKAAFNESNKNEKGEFDFKGLKSHQIRGYGLGVMNARAAFYGNELNVNYESEGRAFGPHGEGLIIANSIENYDEDVSEILTEKTKTANLKVRASGFKPYIAPALSSGALSILAYLRGQWHYSTSFLGGVFMGIKNRTTEKGIELETYNMPEELLNKLKHTYDYLNALYN
ncbi:MULTISPECIES: lactate dehydrogenase [Clostridium]|uniref:Lactate dehydrogenase n=1 Tax=Clostridium faecium TaxID=2762223 RepID=A0ABR8YSG6_9CLOT|nr:MULTISPECIES: lactate dehydrogenase [Clostridium]MBD8047206.1 lactate dehydrogenase [Clostridium faecium]MDU1348412.1 lactate dehydrogenase [Clostridium argentinense]